MILWFGHAASWPTRIHPAHLVAAVSHASTIVGVALLIGVVVIAAIHFRHTLMFAGFERRARPSRLRRFELLLPESFAREGLFGFFGTVALLLRPVLFGRPSSLVFTLTTVGERLAVEVECSAEIATPVAHGLEAAIDGAAIEELPAAKLDRRGWRRCTLRPTGSRLLPLRLKHPLDPARMVLAMLRGSSDDERACVQLTFSRLGRRARRQGIREVRQLRYGRGGGADAIIDFGLDLGREMVEAVTPGPSHRTTTATRPSYEPGPWARKQAGAIEEKTAEPLLAVTIRLAVAGGTRTVRRSRLHALAASFAQFHALGGVRAGREFGGGRRFEHALPARTPLALTAAEAAAMLPLPTSLADARLVIASAPARRLPPTADAPRFGVRLGGAER